MSSEEIGFDALQQDVWLSARSLPHARRRARLALTGLWLGFAFLLTVLSKENDIILAVLMVGLTTILETSAGALAFDRLTGSVVQKTAL